MIRIVRFAPIAIFLLLPINGFSDCDADQPDKQVPCRQMENVTILGTSYKKDDIAGGANVIAPSDLQAFATGDVGRALRRIPGASIQTEDGYGLRPNISIRGTVSAPASISGSPRMASRSWRKSIFFSRQKSSALLSVRVVPATKVI